MRYICPMGSDCGRECYASKEHDPVIMDGKPINGAIECPCDRPELVEVKTAIIESAFETYETEVIPEKAGPVQRYECKQAFYGGAAIVLVALLSAMDLDADDEDENVERVAALIGDLSRESKRFADSVAPAAWVKEMLSAWKGPFDDS